MHPNSLKNLRPRPRRPRADEKSNPVTIRLSPSELRRAAEAAHVNHTTLSNFVRDAILNATFDCLEPMPDEKPSV